MCTSKTGHFSHKTLDLTPRWAYFWSQGSIEVAAPTTCATAMGQWCSCVQCKRQLCWWPRIAQYAPTYWEWTVSIWAPSSHHPMSMSSMGFSYLHSWNQQPNSHLAEGSVFNLILYAYGCVYIYTYTYYIHNYCTSIILSDTHIWWFQLPQTYVFF